MVSASRVPAAVPAVAPIRPERHRGNDGRPRRSAAGQRASGRRHLPDWDGRLREAEHLRTGRGVGPGHVHPMRQLQFRLPAQRDPVQVLQRVKLDGAPEEFASAPLNAVGLPEPGTRCRSTSRTAPAAGCASRPARGHRTTGTKAINLGPASRWWPPSGRTSISSRSCPSATGPGWTSAPSAGPSSCSRCSSSPGLRGLRRDAIPQAAVAAVRRPADDRQRDRLLVHLRRQPAHHALDRQRSGARPGLVESLFEDNAEFGLGFRLTADGHVALARRRLAELRTRSAPNWSTRS